MISALGTTLVLGGLLAAAFGAVVGIEGGLRHRPGALRVAQIVVGPGRPEHLAPVGEALSHPLTAPERAEIGEVVA